MTSFIGGATDMEIVQHSEEEIARIVRDENARILGITGPADRIGRLGIYARVAAIQSRPRTHRRSHS